MADFMPPEVISSIPANVTTAIEGILRDTYGNQVRQDIYTALSWRSDYLTTIANFINALGLCVKDGKLHVIYND